MSPEFHAMTLQPPLKKPDRLYRGLLVALAGVAAWLIAMPVSPFIQQVALNRFHLQTGSFAAWVIQAPIPAMYNFHNRYRIEAMPWDVSPFSTPRTGTLNHFPVRVTTFATDRLYLKQADRRMITLRSDYRGRSLQTQWIATPRDEGGFVLSDEVLP
jgi:hypothetical protein